MWMPKNCNKQTATQNPSLYLFCKNLSKSNSHNSIFENSHINENVYNPSNWIHTVVQWLIWEFILNIVTLKDLTILVLKCLHSFVGIHSVCIHANCIKELHCITVFCPEYYCSHYSNKKCLHMPTASNNYTALQYSALNIAVVINPSPAEHGYRYTLSLQIV